MTSSSSPGAVFANIVLGDEINRASPKTQSALLECMEERQVTIDAETHTLGTPFMVIATQNPVEHEGTYPLPEAQLDRFMLRLSIGYPSPDVEAEILETHASGQPLGEIGRVTDSQGIAEMIEQARRVHVAPAIRRYIVRSSRRPATTPTSTWAPAPERRSCCCGPRAPTPRRSSATTWSPMTSRRSCVPGLAHRIIVTADAVMTGRSASVVIEEVLAQVEVPVAERS